MIETGLVDWASQNGTLNGIIKGRFRPLSLDRLQDYPACDYQLHETIHYPHLRGKLANHTEIILVRCLARTQQQAAAIAELFYELDQQRDVILGNYCAKTIRIANVHDEVDMPSGPKGGSIIYSKVLHFAITYCKGG